MIRVKENKNHFVLNVRKDVQFKNKIYRLIRLDRTCNSGSSERRIHISALINLFMNFRCVCLCVCATVVHYTISRYDLTYAHHHIYVCARVCVCVNTLVCVCVATHLRRLPPRTHARNFSAGPQRVYATLVTGHGRHLMIFVQVMTYAIS